MTEDRRRGVDGEIVGDESYPAASSTWVGAFERVMGDHNEENQYSSSSSRNRPRNSRQATNANDVTEFNPPNRSAAASPFKAPSDEEMYNRQRMRSGSIGTNSSESSSIVRPTIPRKQSIHVGAKKKKSNIGPALVSVSPRDGIMLKDVYFNHAPSLQPLHVENQSEGQRVLLRLSSDLGRAVTFLKKKRSGQTPKEPIVYPGNTMIWAQADGLHPSRLRDIRHLVANLESSDSLILEAGASEDIYIAFRPSEAEQERLSQEHLLIPPQSPNQTVDADALKSPKDAALRLHHEQSVVTAETSLHHFVDVHGLVSLRASILSTVDIASNEGDAVNKETISSNASNLSSSSSSRPPSFHGSYLSSNTSASIYTTGSHANSQQQIEVPFSANYCRPSLGVSKNGNKVQQSGIINVDFGDIFVGQTHELELHLHNQSEIGIFCQARLDDADNALQVSPLALHSDEDNVIDTFTTVDDHPYKPFLLPSTSTKTIRIMLKPTEPCRDYEQMMTFINMHDAGNSIRVLVRANMLGEARDDALAVLTGEVMDFGDCPGGHWTRQFLVLRNNSAQYLDVHFGVEKGFEATFQLAEMVQKNTEEEPLQQSELPDALESIPSASEALLQAQDEKGIEACHATDQTSSSQSSTFPFDDQKSPLSAQEVRTPLAKAQIGKPLDETPYFALPAPDEKAQACETALRFNSAMKGDGQDDDDLDTSSVTSQAGSLPGSPRVGPSQLSGSVVLPSGAFSRPDSVHWSDVASSEGDKDSASLSRSSRPVSGIFSSSISSVSGVAPHLRSDIQNLEEASSTRSEVFDMSQESRLGPFLSATSTQHGGSGNSRGQQQSRSHQRVTAGSLTMKGMHGGEQAHGNQLEELFLRPGGEYRVVVSHRPARGQKDVEYSAGKLIEKTFRLLLDYTRSKSLGTRSRGGRERKTIRCRIRTCTSFISVSPKMIDFGAANVGSKKTSSFTVTNYSELTARVDLRFVSKVLSMYRDEISIPALQSLELRVDFFPRRVNDSYKKQVTVANLLNRHNDEILEVKSKNIDEQKVSFHSIFYRILTTTGSNYLDFGDVNINCTRVRSFSIENISKGKLNLELSAAHAEDLKIYIKAKPKSKSSKVEDGDANEMKKPPNRYAELEASDDVTAMIDNDETRGKIGLSKGSTGRTTGIDLKERFLESISQDMPAIRKENTTWRTAQKDSHYRKGTKGTKSGQKKGEMQSDKKEVTKKAPINLVSALKKGGKGRLTQKYGRSISFKDQKLLSDFEYLDLATGPPVDGKRISVKSRKYQMLDGLETGKAAIKAEGKTKSPQNQVADLESSDVTKVKAKSSNLRSKSSLVAKSSFLIGRPKTEAALHDAEDVSKLNVDELITAVEAQGSSLSTFFLGNPEAEEQSVRTEINLQRELQSAISIGRLQCIETLSIEAGSEQEVIAIYTPNGSTRPHIQGNARKQDSRIFLRLIEFDTGGIDDIEDFKHMSELDIDELPVRELMVKSNICRSLLELSQPHINFGQMDKGETKTRKILIQNRSEWALRFCIRKSGNISSGDIKLKSSDRYGVVPGHGKREVEFVFCPTLTGAFQEKLTVENIADRDRDETVFLKANVRKVSNFRVEPTIISFVDDQEEEELSEGTLVEALSMSKVSSKEESFVISNISTKSRTFTVGIDEEEMQFATFNVDVLFNSSSQISNKASLSKEEEEEVEHISQKLKIASRKGQEEKMKKYSDRLTELGIGSENTSPVFKDKIGLPNDDEEKSEVDIIKQVGSKDNEAEKMKLKQDKSSVTLVIPPNQSKKILIRLRPMLKKDQGTATTRFPLEDQKWQHDSGQFSVNVRIHEQKNKDEIQVVEIKGRVQGHQSDGLLDDVRLGEDSFDKFKKHGWVTFSSISAS